MPIPATFTEAVTPSHSPVELPLPGLRLSQAIFSLTAQLNVPPPVFLIYRYLSSGLEPGMAVKLKLEGENDMEGGGGAAVVKLQTVPESWPQSFVATTLQ